MVRLPTNQITAWTFRAVAWAAAGWFMGWRVAGVLAVAAVLTHGIALVLHALPHHAPARRAILVAACGGELLLFASVLAPQGALLASVGAGVFMCHAIAYLVDVHRGTADPAHHGAAVLYLLQFPVFPAGPLSRFHEFSHQLSRADVSMGAFSYGVRRIVTGLLKVLAIAGPLDAVCDRIFALRVTRLSTDIAWLGAISASLEIYFLISGFSDIGIGVGRVLGFRYQENFRRPYAADSMREFWRRWNVTLVTWLRDYLSLPVEGFEAPTVKKYLLTIAGFLVIGLWLRTTWHVVPWAIYISTWLAIEAMGFGARLARFPRSIRHVYVLLVVIVGWVGLRAAGPGPLLGYLEAMFGFAIVKSPASMDYLTPGFVAALISAVVFAGPLVGWISRWRVSVDAATASLLMMCAATGVFVWQAFLPVLRAIRPDAGARRRS